MEVKHHNTAGCYLVRQNRGIWEILLIYKKWSEENQGWVPPKGHVEEGETLEQAAIRETIEETGFRNLEIIHKLESIHIEYPWEDGYIHKKDIHYFLAKLINEKRDNLVLSEKENDTIIKIEWLSLEEAEKKLLFDDEREVLRKVISILNNNY